MIWVDDNHGKLGLSEVNCSQSAILLLIGLTYDAFRAFFEVNPKHASTIKDILGKIITGMI